MKADAHDRSQFRPARLSGPSPPACFQQVLRLPRRTRRAPPGREAPASPPCCCWRGRRPSCRWPCSPGRRAACRSAPWAFLQFIAPTLRKVRGWAWPRASRVHPAAGAVDFDVHLAGRRGGLRLTAGPRKKTRALAPA
ncbi:hypothetical protein ACRAWD_12155 [Caulobacter segnis]